MYRTFAIIFTIFLWTFSFAQPHSDTLFFKNRLQPVSGDNIFKTDGYYNWCPSIIKGKDGKYHLFYSRWKKEYKFTGWLTHSEIAHAVSNSPSGPWKFKEIVLQGRRNGQWDAITAHNPKIEYFEGKYYLYYIATNLGENAYTEEELVKTAHVGYTHPNWAILRPNQRTGVAVSTSINGPWTRLDQPIIEPSGPITTLTTNPAIDRGKDGKYYLIVKGDKPNETRFIRNQAIAISDRPTGPFIMQDKPVIDYLDTEDMSMWYDKKRDYFYGVFHAHTFLGMVSSPDGINWKKATEHVLMPKRIPMTNGTEIVPDRMERPFVYVENDEPQVLAMAVKKGDESYLIFVPIADRSKIPLPSKAQLTWQDAELTAVFHYDLHVFDGKDYNQRENRITPIPDYNIFNPKNYDTDQWVRSIKDAGFKLAIFTVSHETGFFFHQSRATPYSMKALDWQDGKGDILRDFKASCEKYGILPGVYIGTRWNAFYGIHDFKVHGDNEFARNRQKHYNTMIENIVTEIFSNYGDWAMVWFDGGAHGPEQGGPDVLSIFEKKQPNALFYHNLQRADMRWGGSESGTVPYPSWGTFPYVSTGAGESAKKEIGANNFQLLKTGDPNGKYYMPAMSDAPLRGYNGRHEWFWEPGDEAHIFPLENLMDMYYRSVGRNSTLIIGLTPDADGLLPQPDLERLNEWGDEIRSRFGVPIAETSGKGKRIILTLQRTQDIDHIILEEDISLGERVREFTVQGKINGKWADLYKGSSIGHKHIIKIRPVKTDGIRLNVDKALDVPQIRGLRAYNVSSGNP